MIKKIPCSKMTYYYNPTILTHFAEKVFGFFLCNQIREMYHINTHVSTL